MALAHAHVAVMEVADQGPTEMTAVVTVTMKGHQGVIHADAMTT